MKYIAPIMEIDDNKRLIWKPWFHNSFSVLDLQKLFDLKSYGEIYSVEVDLRDDNIYIVFPSEEEATLFMLRWA